MTTNPKLYIVQSLDRGAWGDIIKYETRADAERGLVAIRKVLRDQPGKHKYVEGYRLIMREQVETVLDPVAEAAAPLAWKDIVARADEKCMRLHGRKLDLGELMTMASAHKIKMTPSEIEEQRQSWARQDMD